MFEARIIHLPDPENPISKALRDIVSKINESPDSCIVYDSLADQLRDLLFEIIESPQIDEEELNIEWNSTLRTMQAVHMPSCENFVKKHAMRPNF